MTEELPGDVTDLLAERAAQRAAAVAHRRETRARERQQFAAARDVGIQRRHAAKTAKTNRRNR